MSSYRIIGIMSGTSMDGIDLAYVTFQTNDDDTWEHLVHSTKAIEFPKKLEDKLRLSKTLPSEDLAHLDKELGLFFGEEVNLFLKGNQIAQSEVDAIASHGHTVFHQPEKGFTMQIGCGDTLAHTTGILVVNDFRTKDIVAGGQGAPLVPIGDSLLFSSLADGFLNIGGFANVCFLSDPIIAFDISPGNLPLNELTNKFFQLNFDENGTIARAGKVIQELMSALNSIVYYKIAPPKSLGTEWLESQFTKIVDEYANYDPKDLLHTVTLHIGSQIGEVLQSYSAARIMITGGGAKNSFLVESIKQNFDGRIILPGAELIDFKEAIVFGFLGALNLNGSINTIKSVTGAKRAVIGGVKHLP